MIAPLLWVSFSINLAALAVIAAVLAWRPGPADRFVLLALALPPLAAALLQVRYLGFIAPTAVLLLDVVCPVAAALAAPGGVAAGPAQ